MSDIVSKLRKLGEDNSIDMSGRHTIAECLNAFGGKDRREISKAVRGAVRPLALPLLKFSGIGMEFVGMTGVQASFFQGDTFFTLSGGSINEGVNGTASFKSVCKVTISGMYKFTTDIPATGRNKGLLLCKVSNDSIVTYANASHEANFGLIGSEEEVYLKLDIDGPLDCTTPIKCNFKLVQTQ